MRFLINKKITRINNKLSNFRLFSTDKLLNKFSSDRVIQLNAIPNKNSRLVLPVSLGRYNINKLETVKYDQLLHELLNYTAFLLHTNYISQVDVISTGDLQKINWGDNLAEKIESYFLKTHAEILAQQSYCYKWNQWINDNNPKRYKELHQLVVEKSKPGSTWYKKMQLTHLRAKMSDSEEDSIKYQQNEYAAILLMEKYTHLIYPGKITPAWAHIYKAFPSHRVPKFIKARLENFLKNSSIDTTEKEFSTVLVLQMLEQLLASENFPKKEKLKLIEDGTDLFLIYKPESKIVDYVSGNCSKQKHEEQTGLKKK